MGYRRVKPPRAAELERLINQISEREGRHLQRRGLLVGDMENRQNRQRRTSVAAQDEPTVVDPARLIPQQRKRPDGYVDAVLMVEPNASRVASPNDLRYVG